MSQRRPVIAGNWKMNLGREASLELARATAKIATEYGSLDVAVYPGALTVGEIAREFSGGPLLVGAQNCAAKTEGAFTGEISPAQLWDAGVKRVLLGHSERRQSFGETDELIARKLALALDIGLAVTLCVGETLGERDAGKAEDIVVQQLEALAGLSATSRARLDIAYEPVWAIGTGRNATPEQAQAMHRAIRVRLDAMKGYESTRILYGGSVKANNCAALCTQPDVEGFLIGGASLKLGEFREIIQRSAAIFAARQ